MSDVCIKESTMREIGNAIRTKTGKKDLILPKDMAGEIESIKSTESADLVTEFINRTIKDIYIDVPIEQYAFYKCENIKPTFGDKYTRIGQYAFRYCYGITEINTNGFVVIEYCAFEGAKNLIKADLPNVAIIYSYAFKDSGLQTIIIRSNKICTLNEANVFYNTPIRRGEGHIYVPKSLIEDYKVASNWSVFANQFRAIEDYPEITGGTLLTPETSMKNVLIDEDTMTNIGNAIRSKTEKEDMILPENMPSEIKNINISKETKIVLSILDKTIRDIHIDTSVGEYVFRYCKYVKPTFGDNCTVIGQYAFQGCTAIAEINTNKVTKVPWCAFSGANNLTKADLPNVTEIGDLCFAGTNLKTLILRSNNVCNLRHTDALNSTSIIAGTGYIYVPQALIEQYKVATNWVTFANQFRAIEDYPEITEVNN